MVERTGQPLVRLDVTLAVLDTALRPRRLPPAVARRLASGRTDAGGVERTQGSPGLLPELSG